MSSIRKTILVALVGTALIAGPLSQAVAQEISDSKLAAAQRVSHSTPQIRNWDDILPQLATQTKDLLIRQRPDLFKEISAVVDETALQLAARRADLENDIARIWAKNFTEEELIAIDAFFSSEVGVKYKETAARTVGPEIIKASRNWRNRLGDELLETAKEELSKLGHEF